MWTCPKCGENLEDQFDSCWQCADGAEPANPAAERQSWSFFILAALMAVAAPLLADGLHTAIVVGNGIRFYQAALSLYLARPETAAILVGARAIITFLMLWRFVKLGFGGRTVWTGLVLLWLLVDFVLQPSPHK